jgi:hypothetical protein
MGNKVLKIIMGVVRSIIILIGLICCLVIIGKSVPEESMMEGMDNYGTYLNIVYNVTLVVGVLCVAAAVIFGIVFFFANIKKRMGMLIGIVAFLVIALVSFYGLASDEIYPALEKIQDEVVTPKISQFSGGGLIMTYILGGVAVVTILWAEVSKIFK